MLREGDHPTTSTDACWQLEMTSAPAAEDEEFEHGVVDMEVDVGALGMEEEFDAVGMRDDSTSTDGPQHEMLYDTGEISIGSGASRGGGGGAIGMAP